MCQILLLRNILLRDRSRTIVTKEKEEGGRERERERKKQLSQCLSRQNHSSTVTHLHSRLPFHAQRRAEEDKKPVVIPSSSPHNHTHAFFLKKKKNSLDIRHIQTHISVLEHIHGTLSCSKKIGSDIYTNIN